MLTGGASGAAPHHHNRSSELFYIASGAAEMLAGDPVISAHQGDLLVVPPGTVYAFAATPRNDADLLIMITPEGRAIRVLRHLELIDTGQAHPESILEVHELYGNYFDQSPRWQLPVSSQRLLGGSTTRCPSAGAVITARDDSSRSPSS